MGREIENDTAASVPPASGGNEAITAETSAMVEAAPENGAPSPPTPRSEPEPTSSVQEGRLDTQALRDLFSSLSNNTADFVLYISKGPDERLLQFVGSSVRVYAAGERNAANLESYLLEQKIVPIEQLHDMLEEVRKTDRDLRELLVRVPTRDARKEARRPGQ